MRLTTSLGSVAAVLSRTHAPRPRQLASLARRSQPSAVARLISTSSARSAAAAPQLKPLADEPAGPEYTVPLQKMPSPPVERALKSSKLAALHARLALPSRFPLQTLARTLVTASADPDPKFNNSSFEVLGSDLLGFYVSEHLIAHYPRIPMAPLFAAQSAYVGPAALGMIAQEWGVEAVAQPGGEVNPGYVQFRKVAPGKIMPTPVFPDGTKAAEVPTNRRISTRIVYDDQFGDMKTGLPVQLNSDSLTVKEYSRANPLGLGETDRGIALEDAMASFVRALIGAIYIHCGRAATRRFIRAHVLSRSLDISTLFEFKNPTQELSILCGREGFEPPVARLLSETGRLSRHSVFVAGIFSGQDKIGEGAGASLIEARTRAATAALMSWYLYSPLDVTVPSETEENGGKAWSPNHVDCGEIFR